MKFFRLFTLSARYFRLHFRQYLFLLVALSFGYGVITTLTSLRAGMEENVYFSAQSHYAGDIVVLGDDRRVQTRYRIDEADKIAALIDKSDIRIEKMVRRTNVGSGTLYFNGAALKQKYVLGVDFENEREYFDSLEFRGQPENLSESGGMLISQPVADQLNVRIGDRITLEVKTRKGQVNTGSFVVRGIVVDHSIFGYYKCYLSRQELNTLLQYEEEACSTIGVYLSEGESTEMAVTAIHASLRDSVNTADLPVDRDDLELKRKETWKGVRYFIITLPVYLSEVADILTAIELISYFLYILMLLIIVMSVMVTYRLILHEREKELGTMQAIVFSRGEIALMLMLETFILFLISLAVGYILARIAVWVISFISFSWIPSFEIFMKNGKLTGIFRVRTTLINCGVVLAVLLPAVIIPVYNTSRQPLAVVLTGGNKL